MQYVLLGVAIISEVLGTTCMKLADGFKNKGATVLMAAAYIVSFGALGVALLDLPLGVAMGIWSGLGTVLTAIVGAIIWKEGFDARKLLGIALIVAGVIVLEVGLNA